MQRIYNYLVFLAIAFFMANTSSAQTTTCGTPTNLAFSNISITGARATWTAVTGASYYRLAVTQSGTTTVRNFSSSTTSINISSLSPTTAYSATISAVCANVTSTASAAATFTTLANASCGIPAGVTTSNVVASGAKISWTAVTGASSYRLTVKAAGATTTLNYGTSTTSYDFKTLNANTTYSVTVAAFCGGLPGSSSAPVTFTTSNISCGTPSGLTVSNVGPSNAKLQWTALAGATTYKLSWKESTATNYTVVTTSSTSYNFYSLKPNTSYDYQLSAVCSGVVGTATTVASFTTSTAASCIAPSNLAVTSTSFNTAALSWTSTGANYYRITFNNTATTVTSTYSSSGSTVNLNNLTPNASYTASISSVCGSVVTAVGSTVSFTTTAAPPCPAPSGLAAANTTAFGTTLNWAGVTGSSYYYITRTGGGTTATYGSSGTTYNVTGLSANTTYTFAIASNCSGVRGANSPAISVSTLAAPNCTAPTNLVVSNIDVQKATATWDVVPGVTGYRVQFQATGTTSVFSYYVTTNTVTATSLQPNKAYNVSVASACGSTTNLSAYSAPQSFTTLQAGPCNAPTNVTATNVTAFTADITWSATTGVSYWKIQNVIAGQTSTSFFSSNTNTYKISNLNPATNYTVNVTAVCPVNVSSGTTSADYTTTTAVACVDANEPNNSIAAATAIVAGSSNSGSIETLGDLDYFSFSNTAAEPNIKVTLSNLPKDYDLRLYNSAGTIVGTSMKGNVLDEVIKLANAPVGTYYAQVFGFANNFTPYACYSIKAEIASIPFTFGNSNEPTASASSVLEFNIFPNPVRDELNIDFSAKTQGNAQIRILDLTGRIVKNYQINTTDSPRFNINTNDLENGMYFINVNNGLTQKSNRIIVNR